MNEEATNWPRSNPHPSLTYLEPDPPLQGQTLYLGGEIGPDHNIYCIPGHANRVLAIYPNSSSSNCSDNDGDDDKCIQIGPVFHGKYKWLRAIRANNDIIYGLPCHADSILRIDARMNSNNNDNECESSSNDVSITTIPIPYNNKNYFDNEQEQKEEREMIWKYHGGAISPIDNCIYCIPQSASRVLRIDPSNESISFVGPKLPGKYKWYGGVVGKSDGAIYGVPQNSGSVLRILPMKTKDGGGFDVKVTLHGDLGVDMHQWHGAGASSDGTIVCIPNNANTVLIVKPPTLNNDDDEHSQSNNDPILNIIGGTDVVATGKNIGRSDRKYKYLGATSDDNCNVYCFPSGAERVLRVNTSTLTVDEIGPSLYESKLERLKQNKWQNGFYCPIDNCVYGIPLASETILKINLNQCDDDGHPVVTTMQLPEPFHVLAKWEGGVMIENGTMYCMPNNFKKVLRIKPSNH